jgi:hypothetical protein
MEAVRVRPAARVGTAIGFPRRFLAVAATAATALGIGIVIGLSLGAPASKADVRIEAALSPRLGVSVELPAGWSGRIYNTQPSGAPVAAFVHLASFPLPPNDDDAATAAIRRMRRDDILIVLLESTGTGTGFKYPALTTLVGITPPDFLPLFQDVPASHAFARRLFSTDGRRFMLWVQFGHKPASSRDLARVNAVLRRIVFHPLRTH